MLLGDVALVLEHSHHATWLKANYNKSEQCAGAYQPANRPSELRGIKMHQASLVVCTAQPCSEELKSSATAQVSWVGGSSQAPGSAGMNSRLDANLFRSSIEIFQQSCRETYMFTFHWSCRGAVKYDSVPEPQPPPPQTKKTKNNWKPHVNYCSPAASWRGRA